MPRKYVCYQNTVKSLNGGSNCLNERMLKQSYNEIKHLLVCLAEQGPAITGHDVAGARREGTQCFQFKAGNACIIVLLLGIRTIYPQPSLIMTGGAMLLRLLATSSSYKIMTLNTTRKRGNASAPQMNH